MAVIAGETQEGADFGGVFGQKALFGHAVAEVADLLGGEGALVGAQFQLCVSEALEDLTEAVKVFLPRSGEYYDIT